MQQQLDELFAMINSQPEETLKQLVQSGANPEDITKLVQAGVQQGKVKPEVGKAILQALQGKRKAAHGAKLNYFKKLKNQCPEGEELYYYKKGGKAGCGCRKKEEGGEIIEAKKGTTVEKFKAEKMQNPSRPIRTQAQQKEINKKSQEDYERGYGDHNMNPNIPQNSTQKPKKKLDPRTTRVLPGGKYPPNWTSQDRETWERLHGDNDEGAAVSPPKRKEKGGRVEKDCGGSPIVKKFKAACGAKMKKHQYGGSLNGIPFNLTEDQLLFLNKYGKRGNKIMDQNQLKLFRMKHSKPKFLNVPLYTDSTFQKINPIITPETKTVKPKLRYAQNGTRITQDLTELAPIYGTYKAGQRFFRNPTWEGAGDLALSALGDAALISGVGAGAGLALKGARAAKAAVKTTKAAKRMYEAEKAKRYYDLGNHAVNEGAMLYGGSAAIKAQKK